MAGKNVANPTAMILAGVDMLDHMKWVSLWCILYDINFDFTVILRIKKNICSILAKLDFMLWAQRVPLFCIIYFSFENSLQMLYSYVFLLSLGFCAKMVNNALEKTISEGKVSQNEILLAAEVQVIMLRFCFVLT